MIFSVKLSQLLKKQTKYEFIRRSHRFNELVFNFYFKDSPTIKPFPVFKT
jgi:hypothetical protein